jgi:predicted amidohydrolase YtcJ
MLELIQEATRGIPIDHLRWVIAHPATINNQQIAVLRDLGIVITTLSSAYIWKRGLSTLKQIGAARENEILPMRNLLQAGVPVCLATDNVPVSLWPSINHVVERKDRETGTVVSPDQCISVEQALRCATVDGAWLCGDEDNRGTLTIGKLADLAVLPRNPLTATGTELASLSADITITDGDIAFQANPSC